MSEEEKKGKVTPEQAVALITENAQNYLFGAFEQIQEEHPQQQPDYAEKDGIYVGYVHLNLGNSSKPMFPIK